MDDLISRQAAIDAICEHGTDLERRGITVIAVVYHKQATVDLLENLPSAERLEVQSSECEYWDSESNFCSLHRPSAEPRYCDRNICASNEVNGISCDECEIAKYHNLEDDDSICRDCGVGE